MAKSGVGIKKFSCSEMDTLRALCDTFMPSITDFRNDHSLHQFYRTSASMTRTPDRIAELIGGKVEHPKMGLARLALKLISTRAGTFILCGRKSLSGKFPYFQKFLELSSEKREEIVLSWSNSNISLLRILFSALKIFVLLTYFTQVDEKGENPSWKAIGYCGPDPDFKARKLNPPQPEVEDDAMKQDYFGPLHKGIINLSQSRETSFKKLQTLGFPVSINPPLVIKCDVVVVGSGSGGGLVAGVLAKAGHKVLVLEKGSYLARNNLSLLEGEALDQMYLGRGILGTDNMDVLMLAGSTVGGGSTINWSASIRTPSHVRKEWSEEHKLELFSSKIYEEAMDIVCRKMGVQSEFEQEGFDNMILRKGCENLDYHVENIPRNTASDHYCGWCCHGCKDGSKKGTAETWLVDLVESRNGAILTQCEAVRVTTDGNRGRKRANGVAFTYQNHEGHQEIANVEARVIVVACGAICTPGLLKRSGLKNRNIGRNLHVHPVVMAWGYFPGRTWPKAEKRSYEGGIMTAMSKVVANAETSGYGVVIQTPALHPGLFSALIPWVSGLEMKHRMSKFSRTAHVFALGRDKGCGVVKSETNISYKLEKCDEENLGKGMEKVLRILAAAGAEEIGTHHKIGKVLRVKDCSKEQLERFVEEESLRPLKNLSTPVCSAHQMGSCRMGVDRRESAVDPRGETWEVEGLFVADSSVFPTALGVNPMVTVQAIAYCTAQSVLEVLGGKILG